LVDGFEEVVRAAGREANSRIVKLDWGYEMKQNSAKRIKAQEARLRDEVGRSGVYPSSGPIPAKDLPIRRQMEWGQGERGAAGYEDHGSSELQFEGGALLGGLDEEWAGIFSRNALQAEEGREVPLAAWPVFCEWFTRHYAGMVTTITFTDGQPGFPVAAKRLALVRMWARVMENKVDAISVQLDRKPNDYLLNVTGLKRVTYFTQSNGEPKSLRMDRREGRVVMQFGKGA
jgi:hypothetical protein